MKASPRHGRCCGQSLNLDQLDVTAASDPPAAPRLGGLPNWGYDNYGYGPSGIGGILLLVLLTLLLTGRLNF
jgi:hypothetical protein